TKQDRGEFQYFMNIQLSALKNFSVRRKKIIGLKYLLLSLPFVLLVVTFSYVPIFGWAYVFFDYKIGFHLSDMKFVGFDNFTKLFVGGNEILRVLRNTFAMSALSIITSPLAGIFAIMLNEIRNNKFKKFVQTTTTLPNFIRRIKDAGGDVDSERWELKISVVQVYFSKSFRRIQKKKCNIT
ncbi:MAG: hypothetical protein Q7J78_00775, partial [Clostridiales bacterium]|nr:hypothetical protein [Clostridiales bacterium]